MSTAESPPDPNETRVPEVIVVASMTMLISTVVVALRAMSRALIRQFGPDDWAAIVTLVFILACGATVISMTRYGFGRHISTISPEKLILYWRAFWISTFVYGLGLSSVKIALLLQYLRLMSVSKMRIVILASIYIVITASVAQLIVTFLQCIPIQALWDARVKGKCMPHIIYLWYFTGIFNILTDVIILVIPLPVLWRLQLPRAQKAVITLVIGLGIITIGVAIARMQWLKLGTDPTWENVPAACWSLTEATTAISCACLPTLKPLVVRAKPLFSKFCKFSSAGESTVELQMTDSAGHIASRSSAVRSNEQLCQDPKEPELVHHYEARPPVEAM